MTPPRYTKMVLRRWRSGYTVRGIARDRKLPESVVVQRLKLAGVRMDRIKARDGQ